MFISVTNGLAGDPPRSRCSCNLKQRERAKKLRSCRQKELWFGRLMRFRLTEYFPEQDACYLGPAAPLSLANMQLCGGLACSSVSAAIGFVGKVGDVVSRPPGHGCRPPCTTPGWRTYFRSGHRREPETTEDAFCSISIRCKHQFCKLSACTEVLDRVLIEMPLARIFFRPCPSDTCAQSRPPGRRQHSVAMLPCIASILGRESYP